MSEIKVNSIKGVGASSAAITVNNTDGTCTANITNNLSNRNLIINGAMQVAQRGDVTGANSSGYKALDRFRHTISIGTWSISQSTDSPDGFANSMKMDCTTAEASPSSASALAFVQKIEGQNLQHLKKGTSGALNITVSFHIKCTKTGIAVVNLIDEDNTRMIGQQFTINSADTWEKKTLTFAGDTSGVLGNDANSSLRLEIWLDAGSSYKSGSVQSSWAALNTANYFAGGTLNLGDNTSNDVFITGVQLEVGSVATDFEHRSFGDELHRCFRYYQKIDMSNTGGIFGVGNVDGSTQGQILVQLPVPLRVKATSMDTTGSDNDYKFRVRTTQNCDAVPTLHNAGFTHQFLEWQANGHGFSDGDCALGISGSTSSFLAFSAEL